MLIPQGEVLTCSFLETRVIILQRFMLLHQLSMLFLQAPELR